MASNDHLAAIRGSDVTSLFHMMANGNKAAFTEICNRYYDRIYQLSYVYCKNREMARDTAQMIFLSVWERRSEMQDMANAEGWLFRAAKYQVWRLMKLYLNEEQNRETETPLLPITPEEQLITKQRRLRVEAAISALPPRQQEVFRLCRLEGWSYRQITEHLGIGKETVKDHMTKALKKLRELLQADNEWAIILMAAMNIFF